MSNAVIVGCSTLLSLTHQPRIACHPCTGFKAPRTELLEVWLRGAYTWPGMRDALTGCAPVLAGTVAGRMLCRTGAAVGMGVVNKGMASAAALATWRRAACCAQANAAPSAASWPALATR